MKVAIVNPSLVDHLGRGTGVYTNNLIKALEEHIDVRQVEASDLPRDVDLYHFPFFDPFFLTLPLVRRMPTVVTVHDLIPIRFPKHFPRGIKGEIKWQIQKQILHHVQAIITDSLASKADVEKFIGISSDKVFLVYLAPQDEFFEKKSLIEEERVYKKYRLPKKFALFVGEVNWNKNLPNLIQAVTLARVPLVIVSKSFIERHDKTYNPWKDSLLEAQVASNNNELIYKIGKLKIEELATVYQLATVLVLPSYYEGFGLPVVEAFASGCPVISSDRGSLPEVTGDAALIINPEKVEEIIKAIKRLFGDEELAKKLVLKGKNQLKKFSWETSASETIKVYQRALGTK